MGVRAEARQEASQLEEAARQIGDRLWLQHLLRDRGPLTVELSDRLATLVPADTRPQIIFSEAL